MAFTRSGVRSPLSPPVKQQDRRILAPTRHVFATGTEHLEDPAIRIRLEPPRDPHDAGPARGERAAARDRRTATDWILRVLEDPVGESDAKAAKSAK